jgi:hypothetical protein
MDADSSRKERKQKSHNVNTQQKVKKETPKGGKSLTKTAISVYTFYRFGSYIYE